MCLSCGGWDFDGVRKAGTGLCGVVCGTYLSKADGSDRKGDRIGTFFCRGDRIICAADPAPCDGDRRRCEVCAFRAGWRERALLGVWIVSYGFGSAVFVCGQLRGELPEGIFFRKDRAGRKAVYGGGFKASLPVADRGSQRPGRAGGARRQRGDDSGSACGGKEGCGSGGI